MANRHASFIDLYPYTKFHWNQKNFLWTDGRTDVRTDVCTYWWTFQTPSNVIGRLGGVELINASISCAFKYKYYCSQLEESLLNDATREANYTKWLLTSAPYRQSVTKMSTVNKIKQRFCTFLCCWQRNQSYNCVCKRESQSKRKIQHADRMQPTYLLKVYCKFTATNVSNNPHQCMYVTLGQG